MKTTPCFKYKIVKLVKNKEKFENKIKKQLKNDILHYFNKNDIIKKFANIRL